MTSLLKNPRFLVALGGVGAALLVMVLVPHPTPLQVRDWAHSIGPLFGLLFFVVHTLACVTPFPRTVFTLSAGLLFGPVLGIALAVSATTASAVIALLAVRALGRESIAPRLTHRAVRAVDRRLARRGWLAVGSLRLIAAVPFSLVNYCAAVSSVRVVPYLIATLIGIIPGTIGVVVLGDALTGHVKPGMLIFSAACFAIGLIGLAIDMALGTDKDPAPEPELIKT